MLRHWYVCVPDRGLAGSCRQPQQLCTLHCMAVDACSKRAPMTQAGAALLLVLLFRMLSSTAEDFFSPLLTQLSQELGLPPRFAGGASLCSLHAAVSCADIPASPQLIGNGLCAVTFLALGNGAPDLSASIAAVRAGSYHLALGSLLGAPCLLMGLCRPSA